MKAFYDAAGEKGQGLMDLVLIEKGLLFRSEHTYTVPYQKVGSIVRKYFSHAKFYNVRNTTWVDGGDFYIIYYEFNQRIQIAANSELKLATLISKFAEIFDPSRDHFSVEYMYIDQGDLSMDFLSLSKNRIEEVYSELYPDIDVDLLCKEFNDANEKILILYGIPGVGKTSLIRKIIKDHLKPSDKITYVKDPRVLEMGKFWTAMSRKECNYLILDDLDQELVPRDKNRNSSFVSQLLSYTSGILEQNSAKIIITTNQRIDTVDPALVRPGRCFDFITLNPLSFTEGREIWVNKFGMDGDTYDTVFGADAEVTQASLMSEYNRLKNETKVRGYIRRGENNYSITEKLREMNMLESRMGF